MKSFLIVALTTLFVSFMPHQAAYGAGDPQGMAPQGDCTTFDMLVNPSVQAELKEAGAEIVSLSVEQTKRVVDALTIKFGAAPYAIDTAKLVKKPGAPVVMIFWFSEEGCYLGTGRFADPDYHQMIFDAIEGKRI